MRRPDEERPPSRSDRKRTDQPFQELARQLAELTEEACQALPATDDLKEEILSAIQTRVHGARNRQIKRLASRLRKREQDAEALREALSGRSALHRREVQAQKGLELLRERLCDPDRREAAVEEAVRLFPGLDRRRLLQLSRAAHAAKGSGSGQAYREIFRRLRRAQEAAAQGGGEEAGDD